MGGRNDQPQEVMIGVSFVGLFKCEDDDCGMLFIKSVDYYFQVPGVREDEQPPVAVPIGCPKGHGKVKFIQSIEKIPLTAAVDDGQR